MDQKEQLVARIRAALAKRGNFSEKKMFGGTMFMLGDKICIGTMKDDIVARVGPDQRDAALAMPNARPMDFTGRPSKGFVFVSTKGLTDKELEEWLDMCISCVSMLKKQARRPKNNKRSR